MRYFTALIAALLIPTAVGCRSGWSDGPAEHEQAVARLMEAASRESVPPEYVPPETEAYLATDLVAPTSTKRLTKNSPTSASVKAPVQSPALDLPTVPAPMSSEDLDNVRDELSKIDSLEPVARRELLEELKNAPQDQWPRLMRKHFLQAAVNKQFAALKAATSADEQAALNGTQATPSPVPPGTVSTPSRRTPKLTIAKSSQPQLAILPIASPTNPTALQVKMIAAPAVSPIKTTSIKAASAKTVSATAPLQVLSKPPQAAVQQASYVNDIQQPQDWNAHLQSAVLGLQASVQSTPGTTEEVNQHLRLRFLQLLAGDEEAALQAIPGATAKQQDYWNKQLFSVSTYLDSERQPDNKRRAAGALLHLDHARAKLAELATMQVRKLSFVNSVDGYGAYELHEETKFKPGASITLYAEIENFSSKSTKEGFLTRLATSYEVLDKNGKRVASDDFPEVEDLCQNPRRDFHMQYTIPLPTRIYADKYTIRLIITDQQSQKIGQASVPFEIVE